MSKNEAYEITKAQKELNKVKARVKNLSPKIQVVWLEIIKAIEEGLFRCYVIDIPQQLVPALKNNGFLVSKRLNMYQISWA